MIQALHHDEFLVLHPALTTFFYILTLIYHHLSLASVLVDLSLRALLKQRLLEKLRHLLQLTTVSYVAFLIAHDTFGGSHVNVHLLHLDPSVILLCCISSSIVDL